MVAVLLLGGAGACRGDKGSVETGVIPPTDYQPPTYAGSNKRTVDRGWRLVVREQRQDQDLNAAAAGPLP